MIKSKILQVSYRTSLKSNHFGYGFMTETVWVENQPPNEYTGWNLSNNVITYESHELKESLQKFANIVGLYD